MLSNGLLCSSVGVFDLFFFAVVFSRSTLRFDHRPLLVGEADGVNPSSFYLARKQISASNSR